MCPIGATCIPVDCCFSSTCSAMKSNWTCWTSLQFYQIVTCSRSPHNIILKENLTKKTRKTKNCEVDKFNCMGIIGITSTFIF